MNIYLIKSTARAFKYNKTLRLNIFNKNIIFYNSFCNKINKDSQSLGDNNNNNSNNNFNLGDNLVSKNERTSDYLLKSEEFTNLDLELKSFENAHKNIQLRLYEKDTSITDAEKKAENSLIEKKENLPTNNEANNLSRVENLINLKKQLAIEEKLIKEEKYQKSKIGIAMFILLVGLFSLWIPLYKTICESQGFSIKTSHTDYKFSDRKCKQKKFLLFLI